MIEPAPSPKKFKAVLVAEVIIATLIVLILVALILPRAIIRTSSGRAKAPADIAMIRSALNRFRLAQDRFPTDAEGLAALYRNPGIKDWQGPFLEKELQDRWGRPYQYRNLGNDEVAVFSFGADGSLGGEGDSADFGDSGEKEIGLVNRLR